MQTLKRNKRCYFLILFFLFGCATSSYRILNQDDQSAELSVSPDRIVLECEWLYDADIKGLYGFMIHVLDEENTVLTLIQGNTLNKEDCDRRIKIISKILKEGKNIYIAGIGSINELRVKGKRSYFFPQKGTFFDNERTLQFIAIANEYGSCYDAYSGEEKPCPREPFQIQKGK
ncbi:MAG: hypothetical protein HYW47_06175 [Deltaproteobacteria bacterium]|nr:hypothetical protein [Deltaproteobacteria bacterium]